MTFKRLLPDNLKIDSDLGENHEYLGCLMQNALNMPMLVASKDTGHQLEYPMVHIQSVFNEKMVLFCHTLLHHHYLISLHFFFQNAPKNVTYAVEDGIINGFIRVAQINYYTGELQETHQKLDQMG